MAGVVAVLVAAAVLVPAGAATAQTETIKDGAGDVWQQFHDGPTSQTTYEAAGSPPNTDLTRLTVTHDRKSLTMKATYVDLVGNSDVKTGILAYIRMNSGDGARLGFHINDDWDEPYIGLWTFPFSTPDVRPHRARCPKMTADIDLKRNTMTAVVPTTCLGTPRWVEVHGTASSGSRDEDGVTTAAWQDSPYTDGYEDYRLGATDACFVECEGWTSKLTRKR